MAVVQSEGRLTAADQASPTPYGAGYLTLYNDLVADYAAIYRTQPNVRTCVSFLARNIAQLAVKAYRRVSDTDREYLGDHPVAATLRNPNAYTTAYRAKDELVHDLGIYGNCYWAKVQVPGVDRVGLVRLPAGRTRPAGTNPFRAEWYELTGSRGRVQLAPEQVIHFRMYNPADPRVGLSPLETLRQVLAEQAAADTYREQLWRSGARISGVIERPPTAGQWSETARERFRAGWNLAYTGDGTRAGGTPILEDGMTYKPLATTLRDAQWAEARKLSREEAASLYHIPPPMVGILDHATFSNIAEQHKMLYQDTLGPWLVQIEEDLELQLLGDFADVDRVYLEFNLAEKLKGSFEEQATSLSTLIGRPVMSLNEGRARLNLPQSDQDDADQVIIPMNVLVGGLASPRDTAPAAAQTASAVLAHVDRQAQVTRSRLGAKTRAGGELAAGDVFDRGRWDRELAAVGVPPAAAAGFNQTTADQLAQALAGDPADLTGRVEQVFADASTRAAELANDRGAT